MAKSSLQADADGEKSKDKAARPHPGYTLSVFECQDGSPKENGVKKRRQVHLIATFVHCIAFQER